MSNRPTPGLPTRQQILDFISNSEQPAGKREIARSFGLKGNEKIALKALLRDMADEGLIDSAPGRAFHKMGGVPRVTVLRVADIDGDNVIAVPDRWEAEGKPPPRIRVIERGRRGPAMGIGDRFLGRTEERGTGLVAHPMKRLARGEELLLGVVERAGDRWYLRAVDKKERRDTIISDLGEAAEGDLVLAEKAGRPPRMTAKVTQVLGDPFAPRAFSLIAIHKYGIPNIFSEELLDEARKSASRNLGAREDLRNLPIIAIDPSDARDHDDAIWAQPQESGGFNALVAIADVSFYVRPGSLLDKEARKRGNSVYFPDRVVPMLPEELSADICSLKEGVDRAALVCHLEIDSEGRVSKWRFARALIRVAANIAYEDAQAAIDGKAAGVIDNSLKEQALEPLWACWALLAKARDKREPLELDLPERRVVLDENGSIISVAPRERLDAHRLVEDFMIAANVAAAKALEAKKAPCMYRVHEPPSREKLVALKEYLASFEIALALGQVVKPRLFNQIIGKLGAADHRQVVMEQILRSQTQAYYSPTNAGHFGLSLGSYAHFTSPIRRYADLLVHRALVDAWGLEPEVAATRISKDDATKMDVVGQAISQAERRAMEAERETVDRYVAAFLATRIDEILDTRITGVSRFGFFATIEGLGGDGLVPISTLGSEYFNFDDQRMELVGEVSGDVYHVGQQLPLRLVEANPVSGALRFELPDGGNHSSAPRNRAKRPMMGKRRRPRNIRHQGRRR